MKQVITFIILTFGFSIFGYTAVIHPGFWGLDPGQAMFLLMWCPALAAITCTLIFRQKFGELGLRLPSCKWLVVGYVIPIAYGLVAYGSIWLMRITKFDSGRDINLYQLAVYGILVSIAFVTGEEIGWRGYLMPNLKRISWNNPQVRHCEPSQCSSAGAAIFSKQIASSITPRNDKVCLSSNVASVICGLVWTVWHLPIIFAGLYLFKMPVLPQIILLTISLIGFSLIAEWLRLKSASIWPVAMLHASHNGFIQGYFDSMTIVSTRVASYLTGESGIAMTVVFAILGVVFWKNIKKLELNHVRKATE